VRRDKARKVRACLFGLLARFGIVSLVVRLKRFEIIGQIGGAPIEPKLPAIGDQLPFSKGLSLGVSLV